MIKVTTHGRFNKRETKRYSLHCCHCGCEYEFSGLDMMFGVNNSSRVELLPPPCPECGRVMAAYECEEVKVKK